MRCQFAIVLLFFLTRTGFCHNDVGCNNPCVTATAIRERCLPHKIGQKCYYKFYNLTTWQDNKKLCQGQGLEMVRLSKETIPHMAQLEFDDDDFNRPDSCQEGMWLAGRAVEKWAFLNYTDVRHTPISVEATGHAHTVNYDKSCGFMSQEDFTLRMGPCHNKKYFLCRYDDDTFLALKERKTWFQAREACIHSGGDLFYLKRRDNLAFENIKNLTISALSKANMATADDFHIGAVHRVWVWPGGDHVIASNWKEGEPNLYAEKCLTFYADGKWNDMSCTALLMALCQGDLSESPRLPVHTIIAAEDDAKQRRTVPDQCDHTCLNRGSCLYKKVGEYCYYLFGGSRSWFANINLRKEHGLEMVQLSKESIPHIASLEFSSPFSTKRSCAKHRVWLGGKAENLDKWSYFDHQNVIATTHTTETRGTQNCGYMVRGNHSLRAGQCKSKEYFLCRYDKTKLKAVKEQKTWFEARETCQHDGGDLFYMYQSDEILDRIDSALEEASITHSDIFHVGLGHRIWKWPNGEHVVSSNWANGEPNNRLNNNENCLMAYRNDGAWNDLPCSKEIGTFCQKKLVSASVPAEDAQRESLLSTVLTRV